MNQRFCFSDKVIVATEEPADIVQNLIMPDNDINSDTTKQRKAKSASLLKKELETQGKTASREFLIKVLFQGEASGLFYKS